MALSYSHKANFATLRRAHINGDLALMECRRRRDNHIVAMVCAVSRDNATGEYLFTPLAEMVNGNPFEDYYPPKAGGGFEGEPERDQMGARLDGQPDREA